MHVFADLEHLTPAALVAAARAGNADALGLLLQRHRGYLYALALGMLGSRAAAEDAVHDVFVTALTGLAALREPAAVSGWLQTILRNRCLMELRSRRPQASAEETERVFRELPDEASVESRIESRELRDWVWSALASLPEMQRATVMLRYFGGFSSYQDIAAVLGIPVGTVRSRLADAKLKLSEALLAAAGQPDREHATLVAERWARYAEPLSTFLHGGLERYLAEFADDLELGLPGGEQRRGRDAMRALIEGDIDAGVRQVPLRVLASGSVTVVDARFVNPPEHRDHCPPAMALVVFGDTARARRIRLHLAPRFSEA